MDRSQGRTCPILSLDPRICIAHKVVWEGELKAVLPLRATVAAVVFNAVFIEVPDELMENHITPGLEERDCTVKTGATAKGIGGQKSV